MAKHIIIVDDEQDVVDTLKIRLEANGYRVSSSAGSRSVNDIKNGKPDLIILDVMMPDMDGFAVMRELKRDSNLSKIPVIVLSAKPKQTMIELFGPEGIAGYISKPFEAKQMLELIKKTLGE